MRLKKNVCQYLRGDSDSMNKAINSPLQSILSPASIAIIGASNNTAKRGNMAIRYLQENQYQGAIYPVHPKETKICNVDCFASVEQLPETPDLALICTPSHTLPDIINRCGAKGIKGAVVLATGFSETGLSGAQLETQMLQAARASGLRIVGPNTSGIFNAHCGANLVGYRDLQAGSIGLLSQSGNMALSLVTEASNNKHLGFSTYIGVGNEADLQFHEYLEYFRNDASTRVIVGYIEGLKNGRHFLQAASQVCLEKPIVIYKSGRTVIGQKTAQSHTGALAGNYKMAQDVFRQAGVTLVERADEILPIAETLSLLSPLLPLKNNRVAVLADGGGHAAIAADSLDSAGLFMPTLSEATQTALQKILPAGAALGNPVDVAGGTDNNPYVFAQCAEILLQDPSVDALLIVGLFGGYASRFSDSLLEKEIACAQMLPQLVAQSGKAIFLQSLYQPMQTEPLAMLKKAAIPVLQSIDVAVRCLASVADYSQAQHRLISMPINSDTLSYSDNVQHLIAQALFENRDCLYEHEAMAALAEYQADVIKPVVARDVEELKTLLPHLPQQHWVVKIISKDILHKTDAGCVLLNINNSGLLNAYQTLIKNAKQYDSDADIYGVLLVPMADVASSVEVIVGVTNDKQYGPVMMFGLGGIFVEVLQDVVFRSLPINECDAEEMLNDIAGSSLLSGVRGKVGINTQALVKLMLSVSSLCMNHPSIEELDLNPVLAREHDYCVLDARIILKSGEESQQ